MTTCPDTLCLGALGWDTVGHSAASLPVGADVAGRVSCQPGGVALNIARGLARAGRRPALLSAVGDDPEGAALLAACRAMGLDTRHVLHQPGQPTGRYLAIEGPQGLVAAIADTGALLAAGAAVIAPLTAGPLGSAEAPYPGPLVIDGNLDAALLARLAREPALARADLRVVAASPAKAGRLAPFLACAHATLYLNRAEAAALLAMPLPDAAAAAGALAAAGAARVLVTDGAGPAAALAGGTILTARPHRVRAGRVTGAGDALVAAHIAAALAGATPQSALAAALAAAADHITGTTP
ncbi:pseudouridine kinase [Rhodovulum iodosum]|uniref:Pseudouridine kinase n=1 Tax=Rhodovulum iodosum TaxID=68291 RepID=A0ABV3XUE3_9RHOB|nr:PfkB family carbohydrate kinase [Rhodovulum robiginosum]RSK35010.1 kinase [Rhodovulum robiginosum]